MKKRRRALWGTNSAGVTLIELAIVTGVLVFVVLGLAAVLRWSSTVLTNTRKEATGARLLQDVFARLRAINFDDLYPLDSGAPNFGLTFGGTHVGGYPNNSAKAIQSLHQQAQRAGFTHFTVDVKFMRRDLTGGAGGGAFNLKEVVTAAIPVPVCVAGVPIPVCDTTDAEVCFVDRNCDGDFYEGRIGATPPEYPDTHIKMVTVTLFDSRGGHPRSEIQLVSLEGFSGSASAAAGAGLFISLTDPDFDAVIYSLATVPLSNAHTLATVNPFPAPAWFVRRGDNLAVVGVTEPNANVDVRVGALMGAYLSSMTGAFSGSIPGASGEFVEGWNTILAHATKSTLQSPWLRRRVLFDQTPPAVENPLPVDGDTVRTLRPYIEATFNDLLSGTTVVSGLGPDPNCYLRQNNAAFVAANAVPCVVDRASGLIRFQDGDHPTELPTDLLTDNKWYYAKIEAQDQALYKSSITWRFHVNLHPDLLKPPRVDVGSIYPPHGGPANALYGQPDIQVHFIDPANGPHFNTVAPMTFKLCLDGAVVVKSNGANYPMGRYFDAKTQTFHYTPPAVLSSGMHTVRVFVRDWLLMPLDTFTGGALGTGFCDGSASVEWNFTVP